MSGLQIEDGESLDRALASLPVSDDTSRREAAAHQAMLTKPAGSLGRLEDLAVWLASWQRTARPRLERVRCVVFAGNHGVAARGVSAYPPAVTTQMVANFEAGGAAINQLCRLADAELAVIALDLERPTGDISLEDAMSEPQCAAAMQAGVDAVPEECDLLLLGEMGIGNTTAAAALASATFGGEIGDWVGAGTGVTPEVLRRKVELVQAAVDRVGTGGHTAFSLLCRLGGRELAAIAGALVEARRRSIPVLLDGFVVAAAAAPLTLNHGGVLDHVLVAHLSAEAGHRRLAERLGKIPVLDLGMRLGEASGAAVCLLLMRAAVETHSGMATFAGAGVSTRVE